MGVISERGAPSVRTLLPRVNLLALIEQGRLTYIKSQWPEDNVEQQWPVYNTLSSVVHYLDIHAIWDPPAKCTDEQVRHCNGIRYSLQITFILAVTAYIDVHIRYA